MADVIRKATNRFTKGLVMDFSPENTKNELLTHALNATLLTFNGNELSLQNDMGNARVETAYLPEGYMPVGTCEYGGIIYIVSYNPLEDKSQIGCFPSPERNISSDELGISNVIINPDVFQKFDSGFPTGDIKNTSQYVLLRNDNLNPGDKFLVNADPSIYDELLVDLQKDDGTGFKLVDNPIIALNLVSIEDTGRIIYLNSDLRKYDVSTDVTNRYHILGEISNSEGLGGVDIDSYRNVLSSGYNIFKSKTSGKLAILAELVTIDSYSVTHSVVPKKIIEDGVEQNLESYYDIIIHTEVEPVITSENYNIIPKLRYYYLENSQGYVQTEDRKVNLFTTGNQVNDGFLNIPLSKIYTPTDTVNPIDLSDSLGDDGEFYFPKSNTYHGRMLESEGYIENTPEYNVYTMFSEDKYHRVKKYQIVDESGMNFSSYFKNALQAKFYKYDPDKVGYTKLEKEEVLNKDYTYYVKTTKYEYYDAKRNTEYEGTGVPLFKLEARSQVATSTEILDSSIEKFQESEIFTYLEATTEDLENYASVQLYSKEGNSYTKLSGKPEDGVTYYTLKIDRPMVSIGFTPNPEEYPGQIFYYPGTKAYVEASESDLTTYWDFDTYPMEDTAPYGSPIVLYYRKSVNTYRLATESEKLIYTTENIELYYKQDYSIIDYSLGLHDDDEPIFVVVPSDVYVAHSEFEPNEIDNYIKGCDKPAGDYPKDDPLILCTMADFVLDKIYPENENEEPVVTQYPDVKLAGIKIPGILTANNLDLPFKYSYTLVPCMNYGKLQHLAVSNTVDFSNLHAFEQSNFTEWRYHIDGNQLRLTFGAEIFDTYEENKVDALFLEFYDAWGFAGSLEITNKKSYSGTFTKLISLNTKGSLSNKRILNGSYSQNFTRNVNIKAVTSENETVYKFKDSEIFFDISGGWTGISDEENDCGVLYSNLIYGVKAWIRRTTDMGLEFIHKKDMVLFTFPVYNDLYYSVMDFNTLENPKLDLSLSYKLVDNGTRDVYTKENLVYSGYSESDEETLRSYTAGTLSDSEMSIIKYYRYKGTSSLYLEIGLHEKYNSIGLKYDPIINNYFKYNIQLIPNNESSSTYSIESNKLTGVSSNTILNYKIEISEEENYLTLEDSSDTLYNKGFLNNVGDNPIELNYQFIIGYNVKVSDIKLKNIETPVICALLHTDSGQMNYKDFNLTLNAEGKVYPTLLYTGGNHEMLELGLIDLTDTTGSTMWDQLTNKHELYSTKVSSGQNYSAGTLYSNEPIKALYDTLGKYTFFQAHAHEVESNYNTAVNIHRLSRYSDVMYINNSSDKAGAWKLRQDVSGEDPDVDTSFGRTPSWHLREHPRYNMTVYTYEQYNSSYGVISTNYYSTVKAPLLGSEQGDTNEPFYGWSGDYQVNHRVFHGVSAQELSDFYQKFAKTMSQVYAYNPDYTSVTTFQGNAIIDDNEVYATSNIINSDSKLEFPDESNKNSCLNNYVYINDISITDYLYYLDIHSNDSSYSTKNSVKFLPNFLYCGTKDNPLLLTSLTYKFVPDVNILKEVEPTIGGSYAVRHSDGGIDWISGAIRQDMLYGYNKTYHKLIPLQVGNYEIDQSDGSLSVDNIYLENNQLYNYALNSSAIARNLASTGYNKNGFLITIKGDNVKILGFSGSEIFLSNIDTSKEAKITLEIENTNDPSVLSELKTFNATLYYAQLKDICGLTSNYGIDLTKQNSTSLYKIIRLSNTSSLGVVRYNAYTYVSVSSLRQNTNTLSATYGARQEISLPLANGGSHCLYSVTFNNVYFYGGNKLNVANIAGDVMNTRAPYKYFVKEDDQIYKVLSKYSYAVLPLTSITLEDLKYEALDPKHKLFLNPDRFWSPGEYSSRVFYRALPNDDRFITYSDSKLVSLYTPAPKDQVDGVTYLEYSQEEAKNIIYPWGNWKSNVKERGQTPAGDPNEWQHNNMLFLQSGPCFMPSSTE